MLQRALHRFATPWYKLKGMRVFRDKTSLSASPALWPSIQSALDESEYFLPMASPHAAESRWVQKEIAYWRKNKSMQKMLIILTDGKLAWDENTADFDWPATTALPQTLQKAFSDAFNPDNQWLVTVSSDTTARIWNLSAEDPSAESIALQGHQDWISDVAFSSDSRWFVTAGWDHSARIWDMRDLANTYKTSIVLTGHKKFVASVAISKNGHWLATGSNNFLGVTNHFFTRFNTNINFAIIHLIKLWV